MSNEKNFANELRRGNYVLWHGPIDKEEARISCIAREEVDFSCGDSALINEIEGIPLTEDWLIRFGAEKSDPDIFRYSRFTLIWKPGYKYWYVVSFPEQTYLTKIEWVHEWQNFVFAMNGAELILTDKVE